jgi:hypothetical protein
MIRGGGSIRSLELWYLSECCILSRFQVLGDLPYIVIVCKEFLPVFFLLLPKDIVILLRRTRLSRVRAILALISFHGAFFNKVAPGGWDPASGHRTRLQLCGDPSRALSRTCRAKPGHVHALRILMP